MILCYIASGELKAHFSRKWIKVSFKKLKFLFYNNFLKFVFYNLFFTVSLDVELKRQKFENTNTFSSNSNVPNSTKWWKKEIVQRDYGRFRRKIFQCSNLYNFREKCVLSFTLADVKVTWCQITFEKNKFKRRTVKVQASYFKMRSSESLYDSFLRSYIIDNLNY